MSALTYSSTVPYTDLPLVAVPVRTHAGYQLKVFLPYFIKRYIYEKQRDPRNTIWSVSQLIGTEVRHADLQMWD